ncbi:MAG: hypothetical protein KKG47_06790 [Proteobacteria bacterium]|nr:hypothetical protein [Pseudomonadota bacterium]MBU1739719.1 hypothetical protein [Pseudomonadota bacterium]
MKLLLKSIGILITLLFMAALVAAKVGDVFPAMDTIAWLFVVVGFGVWIFIAMRLEAWIEKLRPGRFSEDQRIWLAIIAAFILGGLLIYLGWNLIGQYFTPHFGAAVR